MADPDASPRRIWDGELDPEEDAAAAAAAGAGRRRTDTSFRWVGAGTTPRPGLAPALARPASLAAAHRCQRGRSRCCTVRFPKRSSQQHGPEQQHAPFAEAALLPTSLSHYPQGRAWQQAAVPQHAAPALGVAPHGRRQQGRRRGRPGSACAEHAKHRRGGRGRASRCGPPGASRAMPVCLSSQGSGRGMPMGAAQHRGQGRAQLNRIVESCL